MIAVDPVDTDALIPSGPGSYDFVKLSLSAEGPHLRLLLAVRDRESGRKLHVWQLVARSANRAGLEEAVAAMWTRLA